MNKKLTTIYCNHVEVLKKIDRLKSRAGKLKYQLDQTNESISTLEKISKKNDDRYTKWIVQIPISTFPDEIKSGKPVRWKSLIQQLFSNYSFPMNVEMVCYKLLINNDDIPGDINFVKSNVKAALHYLVKEKILYKGKLNNNYIYGIRACFSHSNQVKADCLKHFENEQGNKYVNKSITRNE